MVLKEENMTTITKHEGETPGIRIAQLWVFAIIILAFIGGNAFVMRELTSSCPDMLNTLYGGQSQLKSTPEALPPA